MSQHDANARFISEYVSEPEAITRARANAIELGAHPISAELGAQYAVLAALASPRNIIEFGTGAGVSGLWLLSGAPAADLTTIDIEPEHLAAARSSFADAHIPSSRARMITGRTQDVLPRMNEGSYDIVCVDADPDQILDDLSHALRLVRPGGLILIPRILAGGRTADPVDRSARAALSRTVLTQVSEAKELISALSPIGEGLLQVVRKVL